MRIFYLLLMLLTVIVNGIHAQTGWYSPTTTTDELITVFFVDSLNGWIGGTLSPGGEGILRKTTDGGSTWVAQTLPTGFNFGRIYFLSSDIGFVVGSIGGNGAILKTTNAGETWIQKPPGTNRGLGSVFFLNDHLGWACGVDTVILTTDQGESWSARSVPAIANWDITFRNAQEGWVVGLYGSCSKSTDGGNSWVTVSPPISGRSLFGIRFPTPSRGVVIGGEQIALSTNAGVSWSTVYNTGGSQLNGISFADSLIGWVVAQDKIVITTDGGNSWSEQSWPLPHQYLDAVHSPDRLHAWVVGDQIILKTTNSGMTSVRDVANDLPNDLALFQNYPNPFNPQTTFHFALPNRSQVVLSLFDVLGHQVAQIVNGTLNAGEHRVVFDGSALSSGIYFYRLETENGKISRKAVLLK